MGQVPVVRSLRFDVNEAQFSLFGRFFYRARVDVGAPAGEGQLRRGAAQEAENLAIHEFGLKSGLEGHPPPDGGASDGVARRLGAAVHEHLEEDALGACGRRRGLRTERQKGAFFLPQSSKEILSASLAARRKARVTIGFRYILDSCR